jgi:CHAT domain-containing protein
MNVLHYAGHAFFNPEAPASSGLVCADEVLKGSDLAGISNLPALVFFNACESAKTRRLPATRRFNDLHVTSIGARVAAPPRSERVRQTYGVAESLLRGGIANFIGTYWPVGDEAAMQFADSFLQLYLGGAVPGRSDTSGTQRSSIDQIARLG